MVFILLSIGLILILAEFYLPGAILGVLGALFILGSVVLFAMQTNSLFATILFISGAFLSIVCVIWFALWKIRRSKKGLYLFQDQTGYKASSYAEQVVGKKGVAVSDLKPSGYVSIEGKQYSAISLAGYIAVGEEVEVVSGEVHNLYVVKSVKKD